MRRKAAVMLAAGLAVSAAALPWPALAAAPRACERPTQAQDAAYGPALCADGAPNSRVHAALAKEAPQVMALKAGATSAAIIKAACGDRSTAQATIPMVSDAYTYQFARFDWKGRHKTPLALTLLLIDGGVCLQ